MFIKYPKIHRLGKEETEGILDNNKIVIQEKIDGANVSVWFEDGILKTASRNQEVTSGFNGFVDYVTTNHKLNKFLKEKPFLRLYGEWLVRHSISYNELAYKKMYLFDVAIDNMFLAQSEVEDIANKAGLEYPQIFAVLDKPTEEDINNYVGKTNLGDKGEGVVLKPQDEWRNKFGDKVYAKVVTQEFKEKNSIIFGGNNKHSDTYWETYIMNKYMTPARIKKIMGKIESDTGERLDYKHTPRIAGQAYYDMLTEEIWEISKKAVKVDFRELKRLSMAKAVQVFKDILSNDIPITYEDNNNN